MAVWPIARWLARVGIVLTLAAIMPLAPESLAAAESDAAQQAPERQLSIPSSLTRFDICTARESSYRRHVSPALVGQSIKDRAIWRGVQDQPGKWIAPDLDASRISATIFDAFPIGNQAPTRDLDALVTECAQVPSLPKPEVFIRNSPFTLADSSVISVLSIFGTFFPHIVG